MTVVLFLAGLLLRDQGRRTGLPYPPYFHRYIGWVATMLEPEECLVTDIPWATAWYGGRTSVLLPRHIDDFYDLHEPPADRHGVLHHRNPQPALGARAVGSRRSGTQLVPDFRRG